MLYWNSFEQHPFPGSLMKPRSEIQCLSEYPLGRDCLEPVEAKQKLSQLNCQTQEK